MNKYKRRKLNLSVNTNIKSIGINYKEYNKHIRFCRRKYTYVYYLDWWGECKKCGIETTKKKYFEYYCSYCQHNLK